jgi:hypothetical protein
MLTAYTAPLGVGAVSWVLFCWLARVGPLPSLAAVRLHARTGRRVNRVGEQAAVNDERLKELIERDPDTPCEVGPLPPKRKKFVYVAAGRFAQNSRSIKNGR